MRSSSTVAWHQQYMSSYHCSSSPPTKPVQQATSKITSEIVHSTVRGSGCRDRGEKEKKPHSLINITDSPQKPAQRWSHRALDSKEYLPYGFGLFSEKNDVSTTYVHVLEFPSRTQVALPSRKRTLQNPLRKEAVVLSRERGQRRPTGLERSLRSTHKYSTAALSQQSDALSEIPVVQY